MKHLAVFPQGTLLRSRDGLQAMGPFFCQVQALAAHFERVTLCARVAEHGSGLEPIRDPRFRVHPLACYRGRADFLRRAPGYRREILAAAREADLSLVVLPGYLGALASACLQRDGRPVFHWVVGEWGKVARARRKGPAGRLVAGAVAPLLDGAVARLTRDTLSFFNGGVPEAVPRPGHHPRTSTTVWARELRDASARPPVKAAAARLLWLGRISPEKGLPVLLQALARLRRSGTAATLEIAGGGPDRADTEARVGALGLGAAVRFRGVVARGAPFEALFDAADVLVLPSLEDLQPRVLLEAMARGVPVVASRVGRVPSIVTHERTGLLVPPGEPAALAGALARLLADPELAARLRAEGARFAAEHTLEGEAVRLFATVRDHFGGRP